MVFQPNVSGSLEKAADAMGEWNQEKADAKIRKMAREIQKNIDKVVFGWGQLSSCPTCRQPAWDRDAKICRNCGEIEQAPCAPCSSCRCALCGYEYDPLERWTLKWDGEQWICGRCERNTESKVTTPKRCTCGQAKSGAGGFHSDWCDLVTGG